MADLLTAEEADDLLYFSRTGDFEELQQTINRIDLTARRRKARSNAESEEPSDEQAQDLTDVVLYIHGKSEDRNTPLHYAGANGHADIVAYIAPRCRLPALLAQNHAGNTALHWAAFNGHLDVVKQLVDRIESVAEQQRAAGANGKGMNGDSLSEDQRAELTEEERDALDEREAQKRSVWDVVNKAGRGPMSEAQINNQETVVDYLLERIIAAPSSRAGNTANDGSQQQEQEVPPDALPEGERPAAARQLAEQAEEAAEHNASSKGQDTDLEASAARLTVDGRKAA